MFCDLLVVPNGSTDTELSSYYSVSSSKRSLSEDEIEEHRVIVKKKKYHSIVDSSDEDMESPLRKQKRRRQALLDSNAEGYEKTQQQEDSDISDPIETKEITTMKPFLNTALRSQPEESEVPITDKPDAPQLTLSVTKVFPHNVTTSVQATVPSRVWCTVRSRSDSEPTVKMLKRLVPRDVVDTITIDYDWLKSTTSYVFYCYGESLTGIPMVNSIPSVGVAFTTPDEEGAGKYLDFIQIQEN